MMNPWRPTVGRRGMGRESMPQQFLRARSPNPLRCRSIEGYNCSMKSSKNTPVVDRLVSPLGECLTPESARRLLVLKPDPDLQARVDEMATRHTEGQLTPEETAE
jgi:hypothetical protein